MENTITVSITTEEEGVADQVLQLVRATLEKLQAEELISAWSVAGPGHAGEGQ